MKIYDYTDENITQAILDSLTRIPPSEWIENCLSDIFISVLNIFILKQTQNQRTAFFLKQNKLPMVLPGLVVPPISPEAISPEAAVHRLVVQECPISPSTITDYQDDSLEDEQMVTTHHDLPNVSEEKQA